MQFNNVEKNMKRESFIIQNGTKREQNAQKSLILTSFLSFFLLMTYSV